MTAAVGPWPEDGPGLTSRTRPVDGVELLEEIGVDGFAWQNGESILATAGVAARIPVPAGQGRLDRAAVAVAEALAAVEVDDPLRLPGTGPIAVGALPFSDAVPGELMLPARVAGCSGGVAWITESGPLADRPPPRRREQAPPVPSRFDVEPVMARAEWEAAVGRALEEIGAGRLSKVVLARRVTVTADADFDARSVLAHVSGRDPGCIVYSVGGLVGATPELLVSRRGRRVLSQPMAGTTRRGRTEAEDERLAAELALSAKQSGEHQAVVAAVISALEALCEEVSAPADPDVVRFATVSHLATTVAGRLPAPAPSALALAGALHPTPAVAGTPTPRALALIEELEGRTRGRYAGPAGWVDSRGDGDWAVALRCAELRGRSADLFAGAGIVAGSDPAAEWAETQLKLEPMLEALVRP